MRKYIKWFLLIAGLVAIHGCATHEKFVQKFDGWVGRDINMLIAQIGYPDSTFTLPNKNTVYVYERSRVETVPAGPMIGYGYYGYRMMGYGYQTVTTSCKIYLETDKKGIIVKWGHRGSCVSN